MFLQFWDVRFGGWLITSRDVWPARFRQPALGISRGISGGIPLPFPNQRSQLEELVTSRGHICDFYPKYHCELNFIEQYWGAVKFRYRGFGTRPSNVEEMEKRILKCLDDIPILQIRWYVALYNLLNQLIFNIDMQTDLHGILMHMRKDWQALMPFGRIGNIVGTAPSQQTFYLRLRKVNPTY
jgi:hypothetical protein